MVLNSEHRMIRNPDDIVEQIRTDLSSCELVLDWFNDWLDWFNMRAYAIIALDSEPKGTIDFINRISDNTRWIISNFANA
jgi:hypothetical protein